MVFGSSKNKVRMDQKPPAPSAKEAEIIQADSQDMAALEPPPPPYPASSPSAERNPTSEKQLESAQDQLSSSSSAAAINYPMQPYHTPATVRHLNVKYTNWKATRVSLYETSEDDPLYLVHVRLFKPQLIITNSPSAADHTSEDDPLATVVFHSTTSRIDINPPTTQQPGDISPLIMTHASKMSCKYNFQIPSLPGAPVLTWRMDSKWKMDLSCEDAQGNKVAKFAWGKCGRKKFGGLELYRPEFADNGPAFQHMVLSAMAYVQYVYYIIASYGAVTAAS